MCPSGRPESRSNTSGAGVLALERRGLIRSRSRTTAMYQISNYFHQQAESEDVPLSSGRSLFLLPSV